MGKILQFLIVIKKHILTNTEYSCCFKKQYKCDYP